MADLSYCARLVEQGPRKKCFGFAVVIAVLALEYQAIICEQATRDRAAVSEESHQSFMGIVVGRKITGLRFISFGAECANAVKIQTPRIMITMAVEALRYAGAGKFSEIFLLIWDKDQKE